MMSLRSLPRHRVVLVLASLIAVACVISTTTRPRPLSLTANEPLVISTPVKAHLTDGSIVVFRTGAFVQGRFLSGSGVRFTAALTESTAVNAIALDSVAGAETYERSTNPGRTVLYAPTTALASTVFIAASLAALFGSCPTIYADSTGIPALEAESFSYSIAPLLEKRDVDRLRVVPNAAGVVRLEVRNEALETHYIDQLELLEARHRRDELVVPAARSGLVALRNLAPPSSARDRAGRDLRAMLATSDDRVFASDSGTVAQAAAGGPTEDYIDLAVPRPVGRDSLAVVLHMRSSLLSTTLFYDRLLAGQGARALDWIGRDLARVTGVAQLARWYVRQLGLRISVLDRGEQRPVVRLVDFGPAAWRDVAAIVPVPRDADSVRIRLSFLADEFRIDRLLVTADLRAIEPRPLSIARAIGGEGERRDDVRDALRRADDRRLQTWPGHHFFAEFDAGPAPAALARTYFLAAQGYYVEWVRGSWLAPPDAAAEPLEMYPDNLTPLLRRWLLVRDSLEQRFFRQRVPIV